ncbi:unnamed protein product [Spirodela intermedia]|uniref:Uncharacterized protein n=1 Tax=Spirodela intermedia TaxID=51605 RepID=A0A7I8JF90_SPIIN|nr:unnamed protein product [Spirodela intermedia]CAA6668789.1 unnamed protein product [Spirodela intermedia]
MAAPELQVWDNAAFDDGRPSGQKASPPRYPFSPAAAVRRPDRDLRAAAGEENQAPRPPPPAKPSPSSKNPAVFIDADIEKLEREIGQLTSRLEALRIKKMGREKFLKPKHIFSSEEKKGVAALGKKIQRSPASRSATAPRPAGGRRSFTTKLRGIGEDKREQEEGIPRSSRRPIAMMSKRRIDSPARTRTTSVEFRRRGIGLNGREFSTAAGPQNPRRGRSSRSRRRRGEELQLRRSSGRGRRRRSRGSPRGYRGSAPPPAAAPTTRALAAPAARRELPNSL